MFILDAGSFLINNKKGFTMKTKKSFLFLVLFLTSTSLLFPQAKLAKLFVMEDNVFPSKVMEYEKAQKEMFGFFKKHNFKATMRTYSTDESLYYYVTQIVNLASLDTLYEKWNNAMLKYDQKEFNKLWSNFSGTTKSSGNMVLQQSEYSYNPSNAYLNTFDAGFIHFDFFDIIPGKEMEAWGLLAEYKKLCEKFKFEEPFNVWSVMVGNPASRIVFTSYAKDDVDYYTRNKKNSEVMMKNAADLYAKFMACVHNFSHYNGKPRKDLSYDVK
jgi:hypothetical protein